MRVIFLTLLLTLSKTSTAFVYSLNPAVQQENKGDSLVRIAGAYKNEEVENDKDLNAYEYDIENKLTDLQYHLQLFENFQIGINQQISHIDSNHSGEDYVLHDPHFELWWRIKEDNTSSGATGELGFEFSPDLFSKNIFKNKNGHFAALKYRFGISSDVDRAYVTYILGLKDGGRFSQENQSYKYPSNVFWGARFWYEREIVESFKGHLGALALKNSQNQAQVFYQTDYHDSSWLTRLNAGMSYVWENGYQVAFDYEVKNESSAFGKFGKNQDFEHDYQQFSLSLSSTF